MSDAAHVNALVFSGGGFQGMALVQALRERVHTRIVVCDIFEEGLTRYLADHYAVLPPVSDPSCAEALLSLIAREAVNVVFPASVHGLTMLAALAPRLEAIGVMVAVSPSPVLDRLLDKRNTAIWLEQHQIPTQAPIDFCDVESKLPVLGKLRLGWGGRAMRILRTTAEVALQRGLGDQHDYLWTPHLTDFQEYSADVAFGRGGESSPCVLRRRLRTSGGFSVISESVDDDTIRRLFDQLIAVLAATGAHGIFNLQAIAPAHGQAFISDINPRIGTSATHALAEGLNLADAYLHMRTRGQAMTDPTITPTGGGAAHRAATLLKRPIKTVRLLHDRIIPRIARPRAVMFDLDDTLIDHKRWIFDRLVKAMHDLRPPDHSDTESEAALNLLLAQLVDEGERRCLIDRVAAVTGCDKDRLLATYQRSVPQGLYTYADVERTFKDLRAAGIAIAVLTDNPRKTQEAKIAAMSDRVRECINAVVFTQDHAGEKPNPAGFLAAAATLQAAPSDCVMVGDNYFRDAVGAIQAGYAHAFVIHRSGAFINAHPSLSECLPADIRLRIHRLEDLSSLRETVLSQ